MERVSHERPVPRAACALEPLPEPEQPTVKAGRGGKQQEVTVEVLGLGFPWKSNHHCFNSPNPEPPLFY